MLASSYVKWITRLKWPILVLWLLFAVCAAKFLPNLSDVVSHTTTNYLPTQSETIVGQNLANQVDPSNKSKSSGVVVIYNPHGLSKTDEDFFRTKLASLSNDREDYGIQYVRDLWNTNKNLSSSFLSKDKTTAIALIGFPQNEVNPATVRSIDKVKASFAAPPVDSHVYLTGEAPIQQDDIQISQAGVKKTVVVTVVLVLVILILVFRSIVAPFVALIAIALSYLVTSGLVAYFGERGLPISNFTETFLIAVLFGAGTDYSIIMMNRFREELLRHEGNRFDAMVATLQTITKTVVFSASTVLVSFAVLSFARFGLYRTAVGVSIGMAVVLLTCLIFLPALMSIMGRLMFWPRPLRFGASHKPSRFWVLTSRVATRHSWITLLVLAIALVPVGLLFTNERTFDPLDDIPTAPSAMGFRTVATAFGPGSVLPSQIVFQSDKNLRTPEGLTTIENISKAVAGLRSVQEVQSATRPTGTVIAQLQLSNQNQQAATGLKQIQQGISSMQNGLASEGETRSGGTANPVGQLASGSSQVTSGLNQLTAGLNSASHGLAALQQGVTKLNGGVHQASLGATSLSAGATQVSTGATQVSGASDSLVNAIAAWAKSHPDAQADPAWSQIVSLSQGVQSGAAQTASAAKSLAVGVTQLSTSMKQMDASTPALSQGVAKANAGVGELATSSAKLSTGSQQVTGGVQSLASGLGSQTTGLRNLTGGLNQINASLGKVQSYLASTDQASTTGDPGFYVNPTVLTNPQMRQAMDAYISPDGHVAKFNVELASDPYSLSSLSQVASIKSAATLALGTSPVHSGSIYLTGTTPTQSAVNDVSTQDFVQTVMIVLVAIFILLVFMLRSVLTPLYVILSLAGTYFVTAGLLQVITIHILHKPGISWSVPFFVFLLLVALGVDYSIFLMSRFEEELARGLTPKEAIQTAMAHMGNVIFSAALIMGGTFGSMMVAGVGSLIEIAISVVIGLFLYATLFLGLFIPACTSVIGIGHFWPWTHRENASFHSTLELE